MTSRAVITKGRIFVACCTSIMVLVSSTYSLTFVFTKTIVKEMIQDPSNLKLNLRLGSKHFILDYNIPIGVEPEQEKEEERLYPSYDIPLNVQPKVTEVKEQNKKKKMSSSSQKSFKQILSEANENIKMSSSSKKEANQSKSQKQQDEANKDDEDEDEKPTKKKQVWQEESADIGPVTSSGSILNDTTIIITTNWMPSVPSTDQLDKVINSLSFLHGLPKDAPMIIAVDGAYEGGARYESVMNVDMRNYVDALQAKYDKPHVTILASDKKIMLVGNMKRALRKVHTQYVLVLQHDLPFINNVNHTALVETMETHKEVRVVRFPTARVLTRKRDGGICDEKEVDFESENGIQLTKTHVWSDRNHLTRKAYYAEIFQLPGWGGVRNMEFHMEKFGEKDCSYWGTHLFGKKGGHPTIFHMDGRQDGKHMTSTKRVFGNLTGLGLKKGP